MTFKIDMWLERVLLASLAPLRFLHFSRQTLLLIIAMSLHLIVVKNLNREWFFFNLHSFCIFLFFFKTLTFTKNVNLFLQRLKLPAALLSLFWFFWSYSFPTTEPPAKYIWWQLNDAFLISPKLSYIAFCLSINYHGFQTRTVYWTVKGRGSRVLRSNRGRTGVKPWWRHN